MLTLSFQSQSDVAKFKKLSAGAGPSEDLRQAILGVIGIRVKYLAKHDSEAGPSTPALAVARAIAVPRSRAFVAPPRPVRPVLPPPPR